MQAVVYDTYGGPDVLEVREVDRPIVGDQEVLVRVRAASVNPYDWHFIRGRPYAARLDAGLRAPKRGTPGIDLAGEVEAVGKGVVAFRPGDQVFGQSAGTFAEYVCARETSLVPKPPSLTHVQAAAIPTAGFTALQGLRDKARLRAGQRVLINGAAGGVGTFAVQVAKAYGAEVTGVCSTGNVELVRSIGADQVIDYTEVDFARAAQRYEVLLDLIGNHSLTRCRGVLTPDGTYVLAGSTARGALLGPLARALRATMLDKVVRQRLIPFLSARSQDDLRELVELVQGGRLTPVIDRTYPLDEVQDAVRYLEQGHARGKVVLTA